MKEIIDIIVVVLFVFMLASFIIGFNRQQIQKHQEKLEKKQKDTKEENDKAITD